MYEILKAGGFTTGGFNFDSRVRRPSIDGADLFHGHIGGMDVMAASLERAAGMIENDILGKNIANRYAGWNDQMGKDILSGKLSLAALAEHAAKSDFQPTSVSGAQEYLENVVNGFVFK